MGFKATEALEALTYDFKPYVDAEGTTPEPSAQQIQRFQNRLRRLVAPTMLRVAEAQAGARHQAAGVEGIDIDALRRMVETPPDDAEGVENMRELFELIGELCSNQPSAADIERLPYRLQQNFVGYIIGVFTNPER